MDYGEGVAFLLPRVKRKTLLNIGKRQRTRKCFQRGPSAIISQAKLAKALCVEGAFFQLKVENVKHRPL